MKGRVVARPFTVYKFSCIYILNNYKINVVIGLGIREKEFELVQLLLSSFICDVVYLYLDRCFLLLDFLNIYSIVVTAKTKTPMEIKKQDHVQSEKTDLKRKFDILDVICILLVVLIVFLFIWFVVPCISETMYSILRKIPYCY